MPKDTFMNLSEDKRGKIFAAAVSEFAQHRFSEASINQIVKTAGIPRGSFYQYFNDKEDLYLYVLAEIGKEKLEFLSQAGLVNSAADFFQTYMFMFKTAMIWAKTKPQYNQIGMLMELDSSDFISKLRNLSAEGFVLIKDMIERDKVKGKIRLDISTDLIVEVFYTLMMNILMKIYPTGNYDDMLPVAENIITILKEGVAVQKQ